MSRKGGTKTGILASYRSNIIEFLKEKSLQEIAENLFGTGLFGKEIRDSVSLDLKIAFEKRKELFVDKVIESVGSDLSKFKSFLQVLKQHQSENDKDLVKEMECKCKSNFMGSVDVQYCVLFNSCSFLLCPRVAQTTSHKIRDYHTQL